MKEIIALIPARSGSKGVPNKNIRPLSGYPLIAYSIAVAKKSNLIDRIIVSTDSAEYASIAKEYGAEVPYLRPAEIAGDTATDIEFIAHLINWLNENEKYVPKYFAHLRPTTPIRDPRVVDEALNCFIDTDYTSLRSCHLMSESSYKTFEIQDNKLKRLCDGNFNIESANMSRQSHPKTYNANGYIDVIRSDLIINNDLIHGNKVRAFLTDTAYEIDEAKDVEILEYIINKTPNYVNELFNV